MEGIAARFRHRIYEPGARASVRGIVGVIGNLKFLDGLLAENIGHAGAAASLAEVVAGGVCAIDTEGVCSIPVGVAGVRAALLAGHAQQAKIAVSGYVRC